MTSRRSSIGEGPFLNIRSTKREIRNGGHVRMSDVGCRIFPIPLLILLAGCSTIGSIGDSVQFSGSSAVRQIQMIQKGVGDTVEFGKAQAEKAKKELEALQQKTQKAADGAGKIIEGANALQEAVQ